MARSPKTLREAADEFVELKEATCAEGTAVNYAISVNRFVAFVGPDLGIRSLTPQHCLKYFHTDPKSIKNTVKPSTFNKERRHVNTFLKFCQQAGYILSSPMLQIGAMSYAKPIRRRLNAPELQRLLDCQTHPRDRMIIALGIHTALRASEIASLTVGDVNLADGILYTTMHKNNKKDEFPINSDLDAELRRWITWYSETCNGLQDEWFLIPRKGKPLKKYKGKFTIDWDVALFPEQSARSKIEACVHKGLIDLGYPTTQEGLHTLRRSVARLYYEMLIASDDPVARDEALRIVQSMLNHSSVKTTEAYIGVDAVKERRNATLRGKPFLSAMLGDQENVVQLRPAVES